MESRLISSRKFYTRTDHNINGAFAPRSVLAIDAENMQLYEATLTSVNVGEAKFMNPFGS